MLATTDADICFAGSTEYSARALRMALVCKPPQKKIEIARFQREAKVKPKKQIKNREGQKKKKTKTKEKRHAKVQKKYQAYQGL